MQANEWNNLLDLEQLRLRPRRVSLSLTTSEVLDLRCLASRRKHFMIYEKRISLRR